LSSNSASRTCRDSRCVATTPPSNDSSSACWAEDPAGRAQQSVQLPFGRERHPELRAVEHPFGQRIDFRRGSRREALAGRTRPLRAGRAPRQAVAAIAARPRAR
jgi:hypothetical protein